MGVGSTRGVTSATEVLPAPESPTALVLAPVVGASSFIFFLGIFWSKAASPGLIGCSGILWGLGTLGLFGTPGGGAAVVLVVVAPAAAAAEWGATGAD